jgi:hypothetical protein
MPDALSPPTLRSFPCVLSTSTLYPRPTRWILGLCNELLGPVRRKGSTQSTYSAHWSLSLSLFAPSVCRVWCCYRGHVGRYGDQEKKKKKKSGSQKKLPRSDCCAPFSSLSFRPMVASRRSLENNVFPTSIFKDCLLCVRMRERRRSNNHKRNSPLIGLSIKPTDGVFPLVLLFIGSGATRVLLGGTAGVHDSQSYVRQKK